jgi:uncharacterized protein YjiS (DUF1127 family)
VGLCNRSDGVCKVNRQTLAVTPIRAAAALAKTKEHKMSYASHAHAGRAAGAHGLSAAFNDMKNKMARRRSYRQTVNALSGLSDHELADLGLSRSTIPSQAWQAVYGTRHQG